MLAWTSWLLALPQCSFVSSVVKGFYPPSSAQIPVEWLPFSFRPTLPHMSRKPAPIKIIDLEDGMPKVEEARLRMQRELQVARRQGYAAVKLIHGYGSSGVGGALRIELQKELQRLAGAGSVRSFIAGEDWRISD